MMNDYEQFVMKYKNRYRRIELPEMLVEQAKFFAEQVVIEKLGEGKGKDKRNLYQRFLTGSLGELALEEYLGMRGIMDWSIGHSKKYDRPDLESIGINAGIKTVRHGLFPLVKSEPKYPEIILLMVNPYHFVLCGVASVQMMKEHSTMELIKDERARAKGTKTGYYGFSELKMFGNYRELQSIVRGFDEV